MQRYYKRGIVSRLDTSPLRKVITMKTVRIYDESENLIFERKCDSHIIATTDAKGIKYECDLYLTMSEFKQLAKLITEQLEATAKRMSEYFEEGGQAK